MFTNKFINKIRLVITLFFVFVLLVSFTNNTIHIKSYNLFKIGISKDANEVNFDINVTPENDLYTKKPVNIYWIKYTQNNKQEPLTWIERTYACEIEYTHVSKDYAIFHFVFYKKESFTLKRSRWIF